MYHLIKVDENYYIVEELSDWDEVVFSSPNRNEVEAAKKIAKATGAKKLRM